MDKLELKYGINVFEQIDSEIRNGAISEYFKTHYGKPYSLVTLAQVISKKKRPVEINELLETILGTRRNAYFTSVTLPKLRMLFPEEKFPVRLNKARPSMIKSRHGTYIRIKSRHKPKNPKGELYSGTCIECLSAYKCDIEKNPANLCVCLKCAPNGVVYQ